MELALCWVLGANFAILIVQDGFLVLVFDLPSSPSIVVFSLF